MYKIQSRNKHLGGNFRDENFFTGKQHFNHQKLAEKLSKAFSGIISAIEYRVVPVHPSPEEIIHIPRSEAGYVLISGL